MGEHEAPILTGLKTRLAHRVAARRQTLRLFLWNSGYRLGGADDGLPIPPQRLIRLVTPRGEVAWFLRGGMIGKECILYALRRNGLAMEKFQAILDFGCGCGRILRHWRSLNGPRLYGVDYNPDLIHWCQNTLGSFVRFSVNHLAPPLEYADGQFDFVYAFSVFTHLTEELQRAWMDELYRVIKPGGILLVTLHGESCTNRLSPEEQGQFRSGCMVIRFENMAGANICGAFHPESYVRQFLAPPFQVMDWLSAGARDLNQDIYLLRKV